MFGPFLMAEVLRLVGRQAITSKNTSFEAYPCQSSVYKPRIVRNWLGWVCTGYGAAGAALSPKAAYDEWRKDVSRKLSKAYSGFRLK